MLLLVYVFGESATVGAITRGFTGNGLMKATGRLSRKPMKVDEDHFFLTGLSLLASTGHACKFGGKFPSRRALSDSVPYWSGGAQVLDKSLKPRAPDLAPQIVQYSSPLYDEILCVE